jgi:hypothetical protein
MTTLLISNDDLKLTPSYFRCGLLCLVLFAILCGLLGRGSGGGDGDSSSSATSASASAKDDRHRQACSAPAAEPVTMAATTTSSGDWEQEGYDSMSAIYASLSRTTNHAHAHASGIRRMKSSSSYPELRVGSDGVLALASPDSVWRFYDDARAVPGPPPGAAGANLGRRPAREDRGGGGQDHPRRHLRRARPGLAVAVA